MNTKTIVSIAISLAIVGWAFWVVSLRPNTGVAPTQVPVAKIVDGKQIIDITARGGYSPRAVTAKAGVPTVLRVTTKGTFDCSSSIVIPRLSYQKFLSPSGTEEIEISAENAKGTLQGLCSMGMYNFKIIFQ